MNACKKSLEKQELNCDLIKPDRKIFSMCPSESFDYAVFKILNSVVVPMKIDWSDLGLGIQYGRLKKKTVMVMLSVVIQLSKKLLIR